MAGPCSYGNRGWRRFGERKGIDLTQVTLRFTLTEVEILASLVADQLFRKEFIDSRLPGCRFDAAQLSVGKELVQRMRMAAGKTMHSPPGR